MSKKSKPDVSDSHRESIPKPQLATVYVTFNGEFSSAAANFIAEQLRITPEAGRAFMRLYRNNSVVDIPLPTAEIAETKASIWDAASQRAGAGFRFGWK